MALCNTGDALLRWASHPLKRRLLGAVGAPVPVHLDRGAADGVFRSPLTAGMTVKVQPTTSTLKPRLASAVAGDGRDRWVLDARGLTTPDQVTPWVWAHVQPGLSTLRPNGRIVVLMRHGVEGDPVASSVQAGLVGFVKSLSKEVGGRGCTVNGVAVAGDAAAAGVDGDDAAEGTIRFLLTPDAAYVTGQTLVVRPSAAAIPTPAGAASPHWAPRLGGKVVIVTGAARGIGNAIARRLAREGAGVMAVDVPSMSGDLHRLQRDLAAMHPPSTTLGADGGNDDRAAPPSHAVAEVNVCDADAGDRLLSAVRSTWGATAAVHALVHNAGITRDKTLKNASAATWRDVVAVNMQAIMDVNQAFGLHGSGGDGGSGAPAIAPGGRVVLLSSINGIAGAFGQTNYAFTKGGLIEYASRLSALTPLQQRGITVNAVAPGFIETAMTGAIPRLVREVGRRSNALSQGGLPEDVAAVIAWMCLPEAGGLTGQVVRVCGGSLVGR